MHFASRNIGWMDGWVEKDSLEDWVLSVIACSNGWGCWWMFIYYRGIILDCNSQFIIEKISEFLLFNSNSLEDLYRIIWSILTLDLPWWIFEWNWIESRRHVRSFHISLDNKVNKQLRSKSDLLFIDDEQTNSPSNSSSEIHLNPPRESIKPHRKPPLCTLEESFQGLVRRRGWFPSLGTPVDWSSVVIGASLLRFEWEMQKEKQNWWKTLVEETKKRKKDEMEKEKWNSRWSTRERASDSIAISQPSSNCHPLCSYRGYAPDPLPLASRDSIAKRWNELAHNLKLNLDDASSCHLGSRYFHRYGDCY